MSKKWRSALLLKSWLKREQKVITKEACMIELRASKMEEEVQLVKKIIASNNILFEAIVFTFLNNVEAK